MTFFSAAVCTLTAFNTDVARGVLEAIRARERERETAKSRIS